MAFYNQGARPNYLSSIDPIQFSKRKYNLDQVHGNFIGNAVGFLSEMRPEDFNQPRDLWQRVYDDGAKERFIKNISKHMSTCREKEILKRQITIFKAVDEKLGEALEKNLGIQAYPDITELSFNGSHSALGEGRKVANGMDDSNNESFNNGAPLAEEKKQ
jgi:catalase